MSFLWPMSSSSDGIYEGRDHATGEIKWTATPAVGSNSELRAIAEVYAADDTREKFVRDFVDAWSKNEARRLRLLVTRTAPAHPVGALGNPPERLTDSDNEPPRHSQGATSQWRACSRKRASSASVITGFMGPKIPRWPPSNSTRLIRTPPSRNNSTARRPPVTGTTASRRP